MSVTGYLHSDYAASLAEFGTPLELPRSRGWVLKRQIPGFSYYDAMGCYPLFVCQDWSRLHDDLTDIGQEMVSISLVTDPFGRYEESDLHRCFDVVIPFKEHYVADLAKPINAIVSSGYRKNARKALKTIQVEICQKPLQFLQEWVALYTVLTERHNIRGMRAFSEMSFAKQLDTPGMVMLRAVYEGLTVGMTLWLKQDEIGYGHLAAFNETGYQLRASYALDWFAIEYFSNKVRWLDFGAGAGVANNGTDGLSEYKRGWSTGIRPVYFCGRTFDQTKYMEMVNAKGISNTRYFPAYRQGEFN